MKMKGMLALLLCLAVLSSCGIEARGEEAEMPVFEFAPGFAVGASITWWPIFEEKGAVYLDKAGNPKDFLAILQEDYGLDTICLQVFVDTQGTSPWYGNGLEAEYCLEVAQKAHARGMRIFLSLILGSQWNNAGTQEKPVTWTHLDFEGLKQQLYDYVYETTRLFVDAGVTPEWIKIGNEANMGILLPDGSTSNYGKLAQLYTAGHNAVKAVDPQIKTMVHLSNCENTAYMLEHYQKLEAAGCQYDMIGLSFYPYSAPRTIDIYEALANTLAQLTKKIQKPIMIVEVGFNNSRVARGKTEFLSTLEVLSQAPESAQAGIIYWEPELIRAIYPYKYAYNAWTNSGKPSELMDCYLSIHVQEEP